MRNMALFLLALTLIFLAIFHLLIGFKPINVSKDFMRMDTYTEITVVKKHKNDNFEKLWKSIDSLLADYEIKYSALHDSSFVKRVNNRASSIIDIDTKLASMIKDANRYSDSLNGSFDITIFPIKKAWHLFSNDTLESLPNPDTLAMAVKNVNYKNLSLKENTLTIKSLATKIDVGGIAKGYVIRDIANLLESRGIKDYLISAGGDLFGKGLKWNDQLWKIGIQHPRKQTHMTTLELDNMAIVTSGDYERYFIIDGVRHHHIFDPKTGQSFRENQSVTIVSNDAIIADILSTGLFGFNADSILSYINARDSLECVVVDSSGKKYISEGLKSKIRWYND